MKVLRLTLFPFTFVYGLIVILRNALYDFGLFRSHKFDTPVISVGNLTAGGAGKSPMTEYLVQLLKSKYKVAILSRGYGRETRGFYRVQTSSSVQHVGDEPLQFKRKFPSVNVAVCEDRVSGIKILNADNDVILLDDAFQHRAVKPGFNILLFDYSTLLKWQWLLPTGDLREPLSGKKRADCIVVTKVPVDLSDRDKQLLIEKIRPSENQQVFFSFLRYEELVSISGAFRPMESISTETAVVLLTGIANPVPLVNEVRKYTLNYYHHSYPDHHVFTPKNIIKLVSEFNNIKNSDKVIITTEKDLQRLRSPELAEVLHGLPVYFLPVKAAMHEPQRTVFDESILNYVTANLHNN